MNAVLSIFVGRVKKIWSVIVQFITSDSPIIAMVLFTLIIAIGGYLIYASSIVHNYLCYPCGW